MSPVLRYVCLCLFAIEVIAQQLPLLPWNPAYSDRGLNPDVKSELLSLHKQLVEIESISGNEKKVGKWLASYLEKAGFIVELQHVTPSSLNVFAYQGERSSKILVTSHIDTVPPFIPYSRHGDEIWGRGSVDAKACVAAQVIAALNVIKASSTPPSLSLLFVVGEEKSGSGMKFFSSQAPTNYSAVLFGEPTESKLASGHKGMMSFVLEIKGKAAHSGYPWLGINANSYMVKALTSLLKLERDLPKSDTVGATTLNIGQIEGGVAANVIPEYSKADISVRIAAKSPGHIEKAFNGTLEQLRRDIVAAGGSMNLVANNRSYGPILIDTDIPGFESISVNYGTDIPNLSGSHKRYLYGPGSILVAHGPNEHLTVSELENAVLAYEHIIGVLLNR